MPAEKKPVFSFSAPEMKNSTTTESVKYNIGLSLIEEVSSDNNVVASYSLDDLDVQSTQVVETDTMKVNYN